MRVALIGAGPRSASNARALIRSGSGEVVGVWDRNPARAGALAAELKATTAPSIAQLVDTHRPDLVAIATAPSFRLEPLREAIAAGASAFAIEKPLALTPDELNQIELIGANRFAVVNTQYLWMPHWQQILRAVRAGELGELSSITASTRVDARDQGPHLLSLASAIAESANWGRPLEVEAAGRGRSTYDGVDGPRDLAVTVVFERGRLTLTSGNSSPLPNDESNPFFQQQVTLLGTAGTARVTLTRGAELNGPSGTTAFATGWPADDDIAQVEFWRAVAAALPSQSPLPTDLSHAVPQARILFAALESAGTRQTVHLPST